MLFRSLEKGVFKAEFRGARLKNTFFKGGNIKKIKLTACTADRLTCAFLQNGGADLSDVKIV